MGRNWNSACAVLWTTATALMIGGTTEQSVILLAWACFVSLIAAVASGWVIAITAATMAARRERLDLEHLAEIMAQCAANEAATTPLK